MADPGGIFVKGDDGTLYFIRDELLAAAKVEGEDLERWGPVVDGKEPDVEGFSLNFQVQQTATAPMVVSSPQFQSAALGTKIPDLGKTMSTVMCPW